MRLVISGALAVVVLIGCGADQNAEPVKPATSARPPHTPTTRGAAVTQASLQLSATTHHGALSLSGIHVVGTCDGGKVVLDIGHDPPYVPLRSVGVAEIDRTTPPRRASLTAECLDGRFKVARRNVSVRIGAGPLTVQPRAARSTAVELRAKRHAME